MSTAEELKLIKVVLFKAGIGSFQKRGLVDLKKTKTVKISFKSSVMNDLLKTFSILRISGDLMISGVSYEAHETDKAKMLEDSEINLPEQNTLSALIEQLRGVRVKLKQFDHTVEGRVIGIQSFPEAPTGQAVINREYVLIAMEDEKIKPVQIAEITGIEVLDPKIRQDFQFFLETITGQGREKNKTVTVFFSGVHKSEYLLNFLQEVPAWKTSYRAFLDSEPVEKKDAKSAKDVKAQMNLQAWAIIDNVLDEDWENVDLTLVTGLPVSFIYDSYSPAWIARPTVERKTDLGIKVVQLERSYDAAPVAAQAPCSTIAAGGSMGGVRGASAAPRPAPMMKMMAKPSRIGRREKDVAARADLDDECLAFEAKEEPCVEAPKPEEAEPTFEAAAEAAGGKGLAFKYHIATPVYVKRNNSSLIPLLQAKLEYTLVAVYNKSVNEKHPLTTLEFTNNGPALEEGPISIFMDKTFAGEAMLPFLDQGAYSRVPYAIDQGIEVDVKYASNTANVHQIIIDRDIFKRYFTTSKISYTIRNLGEAKKRVIIEHPKTARFELYETRKPDETAAHCIRFFLDTEPKATVKFEVNERRLDYRSEQTASLSKLIVEEWLKANLIQQKEYEFLLKRLDLEQQRLKIESDLNLLRNEEQRIIDDQSRLRENLRSLKQAESERKLREKYITKFGEQESRLEQIQQQSDQLQVKVNPLYDQIEDSLKEWIKQRKAEAEKKANESKEEKAVDAKPPASQDTKEEAKPAPKKKSSKKKEGDA